MRKAYFLVLLTLFVACSKSPLRPDIGIDFYPQNQREKIQSWNLNGRLSFVSKKESGILTFYWSQDHERYLMRFIAPLGQGTYMLRGNGVDGAYLLTAKNEMLHAKDAETLLMQSIGWHIPVSSLKYWVRGLKEPGLDAINQQFDNQGRITKMQQAGWNILIKRYMDVDGVDLPAKIFMHNDHFKLKLIIQTWDTTL